MRDKLADRDAKIPKLTDERSVKRFAHIKGITNAERLKMQLDYLRVEQSRRVELNLVDIVKSLKKEITSKNQKMKDRFIQNRYKEMQSILGDNKDDIDEEIYRLRDSDEGKEARHKFDFDDMKLMAECPEILDKYEFF